MARPTPEQEANARALLKFLEEEATDKQCQMNTWVRRSDYAFIPPMEQRGKPDCGTAACLAGWAALKLAPTTEWAKSEWEFNFTSALLPVEWLRERGVEYEGRPAGDYKAVKVETIGRIVLGRNLSRWFGEQDGPEDTGLSDRQWMIAVLRKELGMPYDELLDSTTPDWKRGEDGPSSDYD